MCKGKELFQNINILSFNAEGLKPKLEDPNLLEFVKDYDIPIFSKTWKADTFKLNVERFWDYFLVRPKHKSAIRHSGRVTILAKHNIWSGLKLVKKSEGFLWIRPEKSFLNLENEYFFVVLIFHQKNTTLKYTIKNKLLWFFRKLNL